MQTKTSPILGELSLTVEDGSTLTARTDAPDAADYVAGRLSLDAWGRRTRARYGVPRS